MNVQYYARNAELVRVLGVHDTGHACHLKCLTYRTYSLPAWCSTLLAQVDGEFSLTLYTGRAKVTTH